MNRKYNHKVNSSWCEELKNNPSDVIGLHHFSSRDVRNLERFKKLCQPEFLGKPAKTNALEFEVVPYKSPVFGMNVVQLKSKNALRFIQFGQSEQGLGGPPLLHPYW